MFGGRVFAEREASAARESGEQRSRAASAPRIARDMWRPPESGRTDPSRKRERRRLLGPSLTLPARMTGFRRAVSSADVDAADEPGEGVERERRRGGAALGEQVLPEVPGDAAAGVRAVADHQVGQLVVVEV